MPDLDLRCMICLAKIRDGESVWACKAPRCCKMMHTKCIVDSPLAHRPCPSCNSVAHIERPASASVTPLRGTQPTSVLSFIGLLQYLLVVHAVSTLVIMPYLLDTIPPPREGVPPVGPPPGPPDGPTGPPTWPLDGKAVHCATCYIHPEPAHAVCHDEKFSCVACPVD